MEAVDHNEFWGRIPPEEKLKVLHQSQSSGTIAAIIATLGAAGVAIGFQIPALFWGSLLLAPVIFKFVSNETFKRQKSGLMLMYLGARSAARRYAFKYLANDLSIIILFRATLVRFSGSQANQSYSQLVSGDDSSLGEPLEVWVALFKDTIIIMSESQGGARLQFAHTIEKRLKVRGESPLSEGEYSKNRAVFLSSDDPNKFQGLLRLTSQTPAALVVFEQKLKASL